MFVVVPLQPVVQNECLQQKGLSGFFLIDCALFRQLHYLISQIVLQLGKASERILVKSIPNRMLSAVPKLLIDFLVSFSLDIEQFDQLEGLFPIIPVFLVSRVELIVSK
jgi:hypothetical protein